MGYIINNGIPYGGVNEESTDIGFINGTYSASSENDFCLAVVQEFLATGKAHAFVYAIWDGNDYFTGTISRYASGSAQMIVGRANKTYLLKVKSNGSTITVNQIS